MDDPTIGRSILDMLTDWGLIIGGIIWAFALAKKFDPTGMANTVMNLGNGWQNNLKKGRDAKIARSMQQLRTGTKFEGTKWVPGSRTLAKAANRTTVGLGTGIKGRFGLGVKGAEAIDQVRRIAAGEVQKSAEYGAIQHTDNALLAATFSDEATARHGVLGMLDARERKKLEREGLTGADLEERLNAGAAKRARDAKRAAAAAKMSIGFNSAAGLAAFHGAVDTQTTFDAGEMWEAGARTSLKNESTLESNAGFANVHAKGGRFEQAPGAGDVINAMKLTQRRGGRAPGQRFQRKMMAKAMLNADPATLMRQKEAGLKQGLQAVAEEMIDAHHSGRYEDAGKYAALLQNLRSSRAYGPTVNSIALSKDGLYGNLEVLNNYVLPYMDPARRSGNNSVAQTAFDAVHAMSANMNDPSLAESAGGRGTS